MGSQASTVQGSASAQLIGALEHAPVAASHESAVQASLSLQDLAMCAQPVFGSHESAVQASLSSQSTGVLPATHLPAAQCSPVKQALPSEQEFALLGVPTQPPLTESQASSVQELPSSQPAVGPATQTPVPLHLPIEQASVSEQSVFLARFCVLHCVAFKKLQVANLHNCSSRPNAQAVPPRLSHLPVPSHCPSHGSLLTLGRQAVPKGAMAARHVLPLQ